VLCTATRLHAGRSRVRIPVGATGLLLFYKTSTPVLGSSKWRRLAHVIKKDRFKMEAVVGLSNSRSEYFVRKEYMVFAWFK